MGQVINPVTQVSQCAAHLPDVSLLSEVPDMVRVLAAFGNHLTRERRQDQLQIGTHSGRAVTKIFLKESASTRSPGT